VLVGGRPRAHAHARAGDPGLLPQADLLPYIEAILGAYNLKGRRDNKYKARVKITVFENGLESFKADVEERFARLRAQWSGVDQESCARSSAVRPARLPQRA
jgi:sulfite reductase (NADPH) hemoprotein beta-component